MHEAIQNASPKKKIHSFLRMEGLLRTVGAILETVSHFVSHTHPKGEEVPLKVVPSSTDTCTIQSRQLSMFQHVPENPLRFGRPVCIANVGEYSRRAGGCRRQKGVEFIAVGKLRTEE